MGPSPKIKKRLPVNIVSRRFGKKESLLAMWLDIILNLVIIIGLVFIIRTYIISPFQVFGPSMCDTFNFFNNQCQNGYGEYIIVNKLGYQNFFGWQVGLPERGDVVVFHPPHNETEFFIKRVIGLPGETVKLIDGDIYVYNNENPQGFKLKEGYLNSQNIGRTEVREAGDTFNIPDESYLVFGDNRIGSSDARTCFKEGFSQSHCDNDSSSPYLTMDHIEGKAMVVLWPLNAISIVENPKY